MMTYCNHQREQEALLIINQTENKIMTISKTIEYGVYNNANHDVCIYKGSTEKEAQDFIESLNNPDNYAIQECYDDGNLHNIEEADGFDMVDLRDEKIINIDGVDYVANEWRYCDDK